MHLPNPSILTLFRRENYLAARIAIPLEASIRESIHIGILLDVSDSMSGERLDSVKQTLHAARNTFRDLDYVTLVVFGETARAIVTHHRMDHAGKHIFYEALDAVSTKGCTNLSAGFQVLNASHSPYDCVILLTDGQINRGIESTEGLTTMALSLSPSLGRATFHTLGYGADHNRSLLRILSTQTGGIYEYIQSKEQIFSTFGDILGNTRAVVLRGVSLTPSEGWKSIEVSTMMGDIVSGREYWAVYTHVGDSDTVGPPSIRLQGWSLQGLPSTLVVQTLGDPDPSILNIQILRANVSVALTNLSNLLESKRVMRRKIHMEHIEAARSRLEFLQHELQTNSDANHPLILLMKAKIAEALVVHERDESLARLSSGAACLSTQRAVSDPHNLEETPFTSPAGRQASSQVYDQYYHSHPE